MSELTSPVGVAVAGAAGRMGRTLIEGILKHPGLSLAAAFDAPASAAIGGYATPEGGTGPRIIVGDDAAAAIGASSCLIDFTRPEATIAHVQLAVARRSSIVIGTTGFTPEQKQKIVDASSHIPIVMAANFAVGVNVVFKLAEVAARSLGADFDVEIIEAHHKHKVDAPSGTALRLGEVVAEALGRKLCDSAVYGREGITGDRVADSIAFHSIRGGDIVGEHTVLFAGEGERVEVTVRSQSRMTYALGALRAVLFLQGRTAGFYDMQDVLGLR
jgi:4-hydroxy-tetrahydrodipicolinate reductase